MIDLHNHVLYNVDDGSKSLDESLSMIKEAHNQGITDILQTVHFQHPKMENKNVDYKYLLGKVKSLQEEINKEDLNVSIHLGAEVFYLPNLTDILNNPIVTFGNNKFMLIEFSPNIYPVEYEEQFYKLQLEGITPIVAHPERYRFVQNNFDMLQTWIDRDYLLQVDCGSLLGHFGESVQKTAEKLLKYSFIHIIGSDAHNNRKRNFCLKDAYSLVEYKRDKNYVDFLMNNAEKILKGENI